MAKLKKEEFECAMCTLYALNDDALRQQVWDQLRHLKVAVNLLFWLPGDFNEVLQPNEARNGTHVCIKWLN